jgi:hypothetical protein
MYSESAIIYPPETLSGEEGFVIDEADGIAEGVVSVEAAFAPGAGLDGGVDLAAAGALGDLKDFVEVGNGEIGMVGVGFGVEIVAVGAGVEAGEDDAAAGEVMEARADAFAGGVEEGGVELRGRGRYWRWGG